MKKILAILALSISTLFSGEINIAVAANVSYAMDALKAEFVKTHPQTEVKITLGSSGKLTAQIKNGAPYGIFMSADMFYPETLYKENIATTKPLMYAQGALAFLSVKPQDYSKGMKLLEDTSIEKIAIANPKTAPYGTAAIEAMQKSGVYENIKKKLVFAESISQTVSYAVTATQIGLIAKSSLYSPKMAQYKENIHWESVDATLYAPIDQGIVLLKYAGDSQEYKEFYDFIISQKAKDIFKRYGYIVHE
ncbi:MAG: molybdate ABC transporter substrate-binding protein [Sulfurimonas sp. GWF2_37_8]|nr:MAG: molybdate ABC transporter substrate-binding protein [Sulfurimonas sp. GWF2_37_8]